MPVHQAHVGYAHELTADTTVSVDYTHVEGRNEKRQTNTNPIINGRRLLANDFQRVFGAANYLSDVRILAASTRRGTTRFVFTGVLEAPYGVQLSPVVQWASARACNLTAGSDLNGDGNNNDRWVDPATGQQVSINAGRGDPAFVFDLRTTKFSPFGGERRLGLFVEFFTCSTR